MGSELIHYILTHENDDLSKLLLTKKNILGYPTTFVATQINGRRRAKEKLPTWYANPNIVYPPQQNLEQCSSEITARLKCEFITKTPAIPTSPGGTTCLADLTGGFGVDSFFLSHIFKRVIHVEPNPGLLKLARESHAILGISAATPGVLRMDQ